MQSMVVKISRSIDDLNEPIAHKMEAILGSLNRQLRLDETKTMKTAVLTNYRFINFSKNYTK